MALPCLPHLCNQNGGGGLVTLGGLLCPVLVPTSGLCMICCLCALVCCLCQCEDTIKCIFLWVLTFGDFVGVAIVLFGAPIGGPVETRMWP